jgi:hypothetical protein
LASPQRPLPRYVTLLEKVRERTSKEPDIYELCSAITALKIELESRIRERLGLYDPRDVYELMEDLVTLDNISQGLCKGLKPRF